MDNKEKKIILELLSQSKLSAWELEALMQCGNCDLATILKKINQKNLGAKIIQEEGDFRLAITNPEALLKYLRQDRPVDQYRHNYIFRALTSGGSLVKVEDLCDALYLSTSQLDQELEKIRHYFQKYDVTIGVKPYGDLYLQGQEINIRRAIAHFQDGQKETRTYNQIKDIVFTCIKDYGFQIEAEAVENIVVHLYIAVARMQNQEYASINATWLAEVQKEKEYPLAVAIMNQIAQLLQVAITAPETAYLTIHLCSKKATGLESVYIDLKTANVIKEMLAVLENQTDYRFTQDLNLQIALSCHLIALEKRIAYHTFWHNPLIGEIRKKFSASYQLALKGTEVINKHYGCCLPEGEVAYLALHINLGLERNRIIAPRKNVLVVCAGDKGQFATIKQNIQENFPGSVNQVTVIGCDQLGHCDLQGFDCVFTTFPLEKKVTLPVFLIEDPASCFQGKTRFFK